MDSPGPVGFREHGATGVRYPVLEITGDGMTMLALDDLLLDPGEGWRDDAACATVDYDVFFPPDDEANEAIEAKAVCAVCPVRDECLEYALATNQTEGVWGGLDASERRRMRRRIRDRARRRAS
jgi:WhiB family redox-sensing transcriptional regulator